ncbi:MAG: hypothetical protein EA402_01770 [Planctomycetota bacterium]|nr:MAG: hypothetical protein EA402_01770 [Planctomycetota bacterium]
MTTFHDADPLTHMASGQWILETQIARGRFSDVYRAHHGESGKTAVAKILRNDLEDPKEGDRALAREYDALGSFQHPGIPQVIKRCDFSGRKALLMAYCPGHHMLRLVKEVPQFDRIGVLRALARMLAHVHDRGYVHGDVCLENVLMAATGRVYLTGFSNARREMSAGSEIITRVFRKKTHTGGPFTYLAPEIMGAKAQTQKSDIFAFGVCAFLMLCKRRPYPVKSKEIYLQLAERGERADILRYHPGMPRSFAGILNRCVTMDAASRIPHGRELSENFDVFFARKDSPPSTELSRLFQPKVKTEDQKEEDIHWMD